jgi:hypothetical protein
MQVGDKDWVEKHLVSRGLTGADLVKDVPTGYLQQPNLKGFNAAKKQKFMGTLNARFNVGKALQSLGMSRATLYDAVAMDPLFREHYIECVERNVDNAEEMLVDNATTNKMASAERIFLLKKRRSQVYGDKLEITASSKEDPLIKALLSKIGEYKILPTGQDVVRKDDIIDVPEQK